MQTMLSLVTIFALQLVSLRCCLSQIQIEPFFLSLATRELDPRHQLRKGHRMCRHRDRQSHLELQPGEEVAGAGAGVAADQALSVQEYFHQSGARAGQSPQGRSVTPLTTNKSLRTF